MKNQQGKTHLSTIIITLIIFYIGFVAVQFILAGVTRGQIKSDIKSEIALIRGDFSINKGTQIIQEVLYDHGVIYDPEVHRIKFDFITIERRKKIKYTFEYEMEMNLLLFKTKPKLIKAEDTIGRYGY
jgi:hypothetical protein